MPVEHFATRGDMERNLAYRHLNNLPVTARTICIGTGKREKCHRVHPSDNPKRRAIDARQRRKVRRRTRESRREGRR